MSEERVVPGKTNTQNTAKHIARYNLALTAVDGKTVLDAACGSGYGTRILSMVAKDVVGWDIDSKTIDYALKNYSAENNRFYVQDLNNIEKNNLREKGIVGSFDSVVSFETLEHLENPTKTLNEFKKIMIPGGVLIASVPLNEKDGQNEFHKHTYTLATARNLFSSFRSEAELIQKGLSFYPAQPQFATEPFSYYIFIGRS